MSIFFGVFLVIYFIGRGIAYLKYKKKAEGFGFGDVIRAGILGSVVQVFVPLSSAVEWVSLVATYLITACVFALLLSLFLRREKIPFLPAMNIAFVLLMLFGQQLLSFLIHSPSSYAFF
jgi:prepilin signal peptidase PulO-like enzyme (type II secretory pathway)